MPKTKPTTSAQVPTTKLTWLPKKTFELEFSIPWGQVKQAYDQVLKETASKTTLKGFRTGKAPLAMVEKNLDKEKLYQEVLSRLLPITYEQAVKKHNLRPIISPKIQPISVKELSNWQFKATACERPEIKLGNYAQAVKGELAKSKIWVPGKADKAGTEQKPEQKLTDEQKINLASETLLKTCQVDIPDILIDDEVNRMLTRLLDQVNSLNMTIEQYLSSKNLTSVQLRQSYKNQAEATLKMEFILQEIVNDRKIKISPQEIDKMVQSAPDEKVRQKLNTPLERTYIASILAKRQALDYLISL